MVRNAAKLQLQGLDKKLFVARVENIFLKSENVKSFMKHQKASCSSSNVVFTTFYFSKNLFLLYRNGRVLKKFFRHLRYKISLQFIYFYCLRK